MSNKYAAPLSAKTVSSLDALISVRPLDEFTLRPNESPAIGGLGWVNSETTAPLLALTADGESALYLAPIEMRFWSSATGEPAPE